MKSEPALECGGNPPSLMSDITLIVSSFPLSKSLAKKAEQNWPWTHPAEHPSNNNFSSAAFPLAFQWWGLEGVMEMGSVTNYSDLSHKAKLGTGAQVVI